MRDEATVEVEETHEDVELEGGCPLCGGDLALRVSAGDVARSWCHQCRWLSQPDLTREGSSVQLVHPLAAA